MNQASEIPQELLLAVRWWRDQIALSSTSKVSLDILNRFEAALLRNVKDKILHSWFPSQPLRGQAFRSIALERFIAPDRELLQAAEQAGIENILACFPVHTESVIMWVDPGEVVVKTTWSYSHTPKEEIIFSSKNLPSPAARKTTPPSINRPHSPTKIVISPKHTQLNANASSFVVPSVNTLETLPQQIKEFRPSYQSQSNQQFWQPSFSNQRVSISA